MLLSQIIYHLTNLGNPFNPPVNWLSRFPGIRLVSSLDWSRRAFISLGSGFSFSKTLMNVLTDGRNRCLSASVMRLTPDKGNAPEN